MEFTKENPDSDSKVPGAVARERPGNKRKIYTALAGMALCFWTQGVFAQADITLHLDAAGASMPYNILSASYDLAGRRLVLGSSATDLDCGTPDTVFPGDFYIELDGQPYVVTQQIDFDPNLKVLSVVTTGAGNRTCTSPGGINSYLLGGSVSGLAPGNSMVLENSAANGVVIGSNGSFNFPTPFVDGSNYNVTVLFDPVSPAQICGVSNATGSLSGASVYSVAVSCITETFAVGGTVTGLGAGTSMVLQNNGSDNLVVNANGSFTFPVEVDDGSPYLVSVLTQPTMPNQTCSVVNGGGLIPGGPVSNISINCQIQTYTIGGTLSGLAAGNSLVLQNNLGDDLSLDSNGSFVFSMPVSEGGLYAVSVLSQPTTPSQSCTVFAGGGSASNMDISNILVNCVTNSFTIGGTLSGLEAGNSVVIQNNSADSLVLSANGPFTFSTALVDGGTYAVSILFQPTSPAQECVVSNAGGVLNGGDVSSVAVDCFGGSADLVASIENGLEVLPTGTSAVYAIVVDNLGPADMIDALISASIPPELINATWTCSVVGGAVCPASGSGDLMELVDLPNGAQLTFMVSVDVPASPEQAVSFSVDAQVPANILENTPSDNSDTDSDYIGLFGAGFESLVP